MTQFSEQGVLTRRILIYGVVVSFSIAAVLGIIALLSGEWSTTVGRVLWTTASVGMMCLGILCAFVALGTRFSIVSWIAMAFLVALTVMLIAHVWLPEITGDLWKLTSTLAVTAGGLCVACLLMPLVERGMAKLRAVVYVTLAFIVITMVQFYVSIWTDGYSDWSTRLIGVSAILATLGVITTLVMGALEKGSIRTVEPDISPELATRLTAAATKHGMTVEQFLGPVLAAAERAEPAAVRSAQASDGPSRPAQPPQPPQPR